MKSIATISMICLFGTPAFAELNVSFIEGAPKDAFVIQNDGSCDLSSHSLTIDISGSASGLVFDVTGSGLGVEVFQPFELVSGREYVVENPVVSDGDTEVTLSLKKLPAGQAVRFTIDVDDTSGGREITVAGSEIVGTKVIFSTDEGDVQKVMTQTAQVTLPVVGCSA